MGDTCLLQLAMDTSPSGLTSAIRTAACSDIENFLTRITEKLDKEGESATPDKVKYYGHYVLQTLIQNKIKEIAQKIPHLAVNRLNYFGLTMEGTGIISLTTESEFMQKFMTAIPVSTYFAGESHRGYSSYIQELFGNDSFTKIRKALEPTSAIKQCVSALGMTSEDVAKSGQNICY